MTAEHPEPEPETEPAVVAGAEPSRLERGAGRLVERLARVPWWIAALMAVVLLAGVVAPIVESAMRGDDSHVQIDILGQREVSGDSAFESAWDGVEQTIDQLGRPQPIGVMEGLLYANWVPERVPYKTGLAILTFLAAVAAMGFLRMYRVPRSTYLVVVAAFAASLQFRFTHDPALGYYSTVQFSLIVLFAGLAAYLRFLRGGRWWWFALAFLAAIVVVGSYEANQPLVLAFAALHLGRDPERVRRWTWGASFVALSFGMTLLSMWLHSRVTPPENYDTTSNYVALLLTALRQAVSGLPSIYFLSGAGGLLPQPTRAEVAGTLWRAGFAAAIVLLAFAAARVRPWRRTAVVVDGAARPAPAFTGALSIAVVGLVLVLLSGAYISFAKQHQEGIGLGGAHLASLPNTLGIALLVAAAWVQWGSAMARHVGAIAVAVVAVFALVAATQYTNLRVVAFERPGVEQRDLLRDGLDRGVMVDIPTTQTVYVTNRDLAWGFGNVIYYGGTMDYLLLLETGQRYDVRALGSADGTCPEATGFPLADCADPTQLVAYLSPRAAPDGGSVIAASGIPAGRLERRGAPKITVVAHGASAKGEAPRIQGNLPDRSAWSAEDVAWTKEDLGDGWARYRASPPPGLRPVAVTLNDTGSRIDFTKPEENTPDRVVRLFGTKDLLF